MDYGQLESLRNGHPAWRLLAADNAVLVASFLDKIARALKVPAAQLIEEVPAPGKRS